MFPVVLLETFSEDSSRPFFLEGNFLPLNGILINFKTVSLSNENLFRAKCSNLCRLDISNRFASFIT